MFNLLKYVLVYLLVFPFSCGSLSAEERDFVNAKGVSIRAEIVEVSGAGVVLSLSKNGKKYTVPIDSLSDKDQTYIAAWKAEYEANKHPLGWKKVRIHSEDENLFFHCESLHSRSWHPLEKVAELYLPKGAYIEITQSGLHSAGGVRFDGQTTDYYITTIGHEIYLSEQADERGMRINFKGFEYLSELSAKEKNELKKFAEQGGLLQLRKSPYDDEKHDWRSLKASNAVLDISASEMDWSMLGAEMKRLIVLPRGTPQIDLTGIDELAELTHLSVLFVEPPVGLEEIAKLKNLKSLVLYGKFSPDDLQKLANIKGLKHLVLHNSIEGNGSRDEYDFIGGYTELQSLVMMRRHAQSKPINEMILTGLTDLTYLDIDEASFNNGRKSLDSLKKLTHCPE